MDSGTKSVDSCSGAGRARVDGKFLARGSERLRLKGVTYGPFAPNDAGEPFPRRDRVLADFALMTSAGINAIRTYYAPPNWFLDLTDESGINVLIDVPWSKHLCFLDDREHQVEARDAVRRAASVGRTHPSVAAYSIGNEIPPDVVRWHGERRVERFLSQLTDVGRQTDPEGLFTYASYPPTEYIDPSCVDFLTFNVYLHDRETFGRYLARLQNIADSKPLVLGELGLDTLRHGEQEQAEFLRGHLCEALLGGVAGTFVFSWTDDWFTGGHQIEDWRFGVTDVDREPKPAYNAVRDVYTPSPAGLLETTPSVSVVVCSYNGGGTLRECLASLGEMDYPDYEVILVDDGSTDNAREIAGEFPNVRAIHQENQGLSAARNVGLHASTGDIVAYTDSDCFADPDWLTLLVDRLEKTGAGAVGGPNLTPPDGPVAECVAASPGQPTHVLHGDIVAEHIPGCNMAFRREVLERIGGFDPTYRTAGDDVDICWRVQEAGEWIAFAPSAFVWHHRRATPRAYLRQQAGYGEAEALLRFKHPERFNARGDGQWQGVVYGRAGDGLRVGKPIVNRGVFAADLFQSVYQPEAPHWTHVPTNLSWHIGTAVVALLAVVWWPSLVVAGAMLATSLAIAGAQASQVHLAPEHDSLASRLVVTGLRLAQPLARAWGRIETRMRLYRAPRCALSGGRPRTRMPFTGWGHVCYWSTDWHERTTLLSNLLSRLRGDGWTVTVDNQQALWDMRVHSSPWSSVQIRTVQEDHGSGGRLIRARYRLRLTKLTWAVLAMGALGAATTVMYDSLPAAISLAVAGAATWAAWRQGAALASRVMGIMTEVAETLGMLECDTKAGAVAPENPEVTPPVPPPAGPPPLKGATPVGRALIDNPPRIASRLEEAPAEILER